MPSQDEWGHDPSVQSLRRMFSHMETSQQELLNRLNISFFDPRLRHIREHTRELFEKIWPQADREGLIEREEDTTLLYIHCLAKSLNSNGISIPNSMLPDHGRIVKFLLEKLK
jgi:hypothetical protein